ncbi:unnamed protein product [Laminaria digitata]
MKPTQPGPTPTPWATISTLGSDELSARTATSKVAGAGPLTTISGTDVGFIVGKDGHRRRRERGSGRASLDPIVRSVELEFARYWQEVDVLRKLEKKEVSKSAGKSKTLS